MYHKYFLIATVITYKKPCMKFANEGNYFNSKIF